MHDVYISDHALLRFIERIVDVDLDDLRAKLLTQGVRHAILAGATAIDVEGVKFVVKNRTIVTTLASGHGFKAEEECVLTIEDAEFRRNLRALCRTESVGDDKPERTDD